MFVRSERLIRPLSKLAWVEKIVLFGIFTTKFFDRMSPYALKILSQICTKMPDFFNPSEFRKRSIAYLT